MKSIKLSSGLLFAIAMLTTQPGLAQGASKTANLSMLTQKPNMTIMHNMIPAQILNNTISNQAKDRNGLGPSSSPIPLHELVSVNGLENFGLSDLRDLANLSLEIYQDANPTSGIYYYKTSRYFLHWSADEGYFLTVDYKVKQESQKNVLVDARLTPGPVGSDLKLLRELLKNYLAKLPNGTRPHSDSAIRFLPLPAEYQPSFNLSALNVDQADMFVSGVDQDTGQIGLTLTTDVATRELLIKKLGDNLGLSGNVRITPQEVTPDQPAVAPFDVTVGMQLADSSVYADTRWQRQTGKYSEFNNRHPFPVKLKSLAYLYRDRNQNLHVAGYDLNDVRLNPGGIAKVPNASINPQIDQKNKVIQAWYIYSLINDEQYRDAVVEKITGGISTIPERNLTIEVVRGNALFEQFNLFRISVVVRSAYFDPDQSSVLEKSYELTADESAKNVAPLYVNQQDDSSLYEYRIALITNDGTPHFEEQWRSASVGTFANSIFIGAKQVEEILQQ